MARFGWPSVIAGALFTGTALTQGSLQLFRSREVISDALANNHFTVTRREVPRRGSILTADHKPLAEDTAGWQVAVKFSKVPQCRGFYGDLSMATGIPEAEFERLSDSERVQTWPDTLDSREAEAVNRVKTLWRADGLSVVPSPTRNYPFGQGGAAVTGTMDPGRAARGLEGEFDAALRGVPGTRIGLVDRTGAFEPARLDGSSREKQDGADIVTTIDSELQAAAIRVLSQTVSENDAVSGSVVIMDPKTGDVLAMVGFPSFNPNGEPGAPGERISGLVAPYMGRIEPGSMLKVLTLAKALDAKVIDPKADFDCTGELTVWADKKVRCDSHHGNRAHGEVDAEKAIAVSCNCSAARWALKIGRKPFFDYLASLGLFHPTGLNLPGEVKGSIDRNDPAWGLQLADLGFGQSMTCTPLELASAMASLGNEGVRMQPRLVERVGDKLCPPVPLGRSMSASSAQTVLGYMRGVFDKPYGTGHSLRLPGYDLAGKTGTAQRKNSGAGYVSNFVGFVPAEKPRAMILVMIDNPRKGAYYGSAVAGPVFKLLAEAAIRRYQIPPSQAPK